MSVPADFHLVFVEGGSLRLRLGTPDRPAMIVGAVVKELAQSHGHLLYRLGIEEVEHAERYAELVAAVRGALAL
ncbi:MAG: hypothetical protein EXR71_10250 [Myxococcales bacterium]|nr:hypothetical protein [Myxococcales bacterium]